MIKTLAGTASLIIALVCSVLESAHAREAKISFDGYGPARIGMTKAALQSALGKRLTKDEISEDPNSCEVVAPVGESEGISYMFVDRKLARIDISTDRVMTVSGARVGSSQRSVVALYPGRIAVSPHAYTAPDGSYLTLLSSDKTRGIRFETDHGKVIGFYAGTAESIQYVEGCQ